MPVAGPLAVPKSLSQVFVPVESTRAAIPADNPQNPQKIALGEESFFDGRLAVDGTVACSTCHDPAPAFSDARPVSVGVKGCEGQRNVPTIPNSLYKLAQFWDGRTKTLEDQASLPIINPCEMGQPNVEAAVAEIAKFPQYQQAFREVFGRPPEVTDLARAIASYERTQFSFDSPFDQFMAGEKNEIGDSAKAGWQLFNRKARRNQCHALSEDKQDPTYLMDKDFHNIGIGIIRHNVLAEACQAEQQIDSGNLIEVERAAIASDMSALGRRFLVTKKEAAIASFKTPGLRNVPVTAPYFHGDSQATLWDVLDHYNKGDGIRDPWLDQDGQLRAVSEAEMDDGVTFLASLTSSQYKEQGIREVERQRALSRTDRPQRDTPHRFGPKPVEPKPSRNRAALPAATNSK